jgi:hypothetical protein
MTLRLIPWCLAAMGFLAALTVFTWQGELGSPDLRVQPHAAVRRLLIPPASQEPEPVAQTLILPLPPATQLGPEPNVQAVPDDEPTVDDLPPPRSPPESPQNE